MDLESLLVNDVETLLGPSGIATEAHGGPLRYNALQCDYAGRVARTLARGDDAQRAAVTLLQAATGCGKTIGYAVPLLCYAARTGARVAIATYTLQLQQQALRDVATIQGCVHRVTHGKWLTVARRVGNPPTPTPMPSLLSWQT